MAGGVPLVTLTSRFLRAILATECVLPSLITEAVVISFYDTAT